LLFVMRIPVVIMVNVMLFPALSALPVAEPRRQSRQAARSPSGKCGRPPGRLAIRVQALMQDLPAVLDADAAPSFAFRLHPGDALPSSHPVLRARASRFRAGHAGVSAQTG
jgi:hypothetical protein